MDADGRRDRLLAPRPRLCAVPTCRNHRHYGNIFCYRHSVKEWKYAHPEMEALTVAAIWEGVKATEPWLYIPPKKFHRFNGVSMRGARLRERESVNNALTQLRLLLDPERVPDDYPKTRASIRSLSRRRTSRLQKEPVSPLEALKIVLAVAHLQSISPSKFLPDVWGKPAGTVYWTQTAWALLRARYPRPTKYPERRGMEWFFAKLRDATALVIAQWLMERDQEAEDQQTRWRKERMNKPVDQQQQQEPSFEQRMALWKARLDAAKGDYTKRMQIMAQMPQKPKEYMQQQETKSTPWSVSKNIPTNWEEPR